MTTGPSEAPAFRERQPDSSVVEIDCGEVVIGPLRHSFDERRPASLYAAFLDAVRAARVSPFDDVVHLRRADLERIADHLGVELTTVVDGVASALGATERQRATIAALFVAGATVVAFAAALWNDVAANSVSSDGADVPAVEIAGPPADRPWLLALDPIGPTTTSTTTPTTVAPSVDWGAPAAQRSTISDPAVWAIPHLHASPTTTNPVADPTAPTTTTPVADPTAPTTTSPVADTTTTSVAEEGAETGVAADGSTVAVGTPPVPGPTVPTGTVVGSDGTVHDVAVGTPPVPPAGD